MKIMIVEDDISIRRVIKSIVLCNAIEFEEIIECGSGEEAIKNYAIHKPHCVLMDVELEEMNGLEATKIIIAQDNDAMVIIVTSYNTPTFRNKAIEVGAKGFVTKDNLSEVLPLIKAIAG